MGRRHNFRVRVWVTVRVRVRERVRVSYRVRIRVRCPGGGYFEKSCTWMCLPDFEILTFFGAIPNFVPIYHSSIYQFWTKKHPILLKLDAFYHHMLKIHPIYVNWVFSYMMKTTWSLYQNPRKSAPKRQAHRPIRIPCQREYPGGPIGVLSSREKKWHIALFWVSTFG